MKQIPKQIHAFTTKHNGRARAIITDITIHPPFDPETHPVPKDEYTTKALWDTGATASVITTEAVKALNLVPVGKVLVTHAGGEEFVDTHIVNLLLPNRVGVKGVVVTECKGLPNGVNALIGMDIIAQGDFAITNVNGETCMSFRIPSVETIDYVRDARITTESAAKPNDPCPCGSGKKYKKCCGRMA